VCIFDHVPKEYIDFGLVHPDVADKSAGLMLTISGSAIDNRDYMVVSALRLDRDNNYYVTDMDPIVMVYDNEKNSPEASGVIRFHGNFEGRTEPTNFCISHSIAEIKRCINQEEYSFEAAPIRYQNATHYMANIYKRIFDENKK
ncbi:MAG: hypothetical protein ACE5HX_15740, partial [bacterium]